jgi:hypothetical protein
MWVGGAVPASGANVCIADGTPGTSSVTLDETVTVGSLYIDSGDTLTISNNTTITVTGSISNSGQISIVAGNSTAALILSGNVTLTGGGAVAMSTTGGGGNAYIYQNGGSTLINVNNTIQGAGTIGYNGLTVVNDAAGIINANTTGAGLYMNPSSLTNQGLMEATSGGILQLVGGATFNNAGAHITSKRQRLDGGIPVRPHRSGRNTYDCQRRDARDIGQRQQRHVRREHSRRDHLRWHLLGHK